MNFNERNQPNSTEQASERIEVLEEEIKTITQDLKDKNDLEFESNDDYENWKHRARSARDHKEREVTYCKDWIRRFLRRQKGQAARPKIAQFVDRVLKENPYKTLYHQDKKPTTIEEIHERKQRILQVKNERLEKKAELKILSLKISATPTIYEAHKKRLLAQNQQMQQELSFLKACEKDLKKELAAKRGENFKMKNFEKPVDMIFYLFSILKKLEEDGYWKRPIKGSRYASLKEIEDYMEEVKKESRVTP